MLSAGDRGRLAEGVRASGSRLVDDVRGDSWPMNAAAAFILVRQGRPLGAVAEELAVEFGLPAARARADVLAFALSLNAFLLLNVEHGARRMRRWRDFLALALRLAPAGAFPATLARRKRLDTRSVSRAIATAVVAAAPRALVVACLAAVVVGHVVLVAGAAGIGVAVVVGLGAGAGFAAHEAGHAAALVGVPAALVLSGRRTYVLHGAVPPARRETVALAGPAPVVGLGCLLAFLATLTSAPLLAVAGLAPAAHAVSLTVATGDGRAACGL